MTIRKFNLVPMLYENYSLLLKTVTPNNPNYRNDVSKKIIELMCQQMQQLQSPLGSFFSYR